MGDPVQYSSDGTTASQDGKFLEQAVGEQQRYLSFMLRGKAYGIGILTIKEIIEYVAVTRLPLVPDYIRGVINLRGSVVPVIDLTARLGQGRSDESKRSCIVVIEIEFDEEVLDIGVMVDSVNEVLGLDVEDIEPPPPFGAIIRTDFIKGMGRVKEKFVTLLDIDQVLSIKELAQFPELVNGGGRAMLRQTLVSTTNEEGRSD